MNSRCMICNELVNEWQTIRVQDDRSKFDIEGHISCTEEIWKKVKAIRNIEKKSVQKILDEIGLDIETGGKQDGN